MLIFFWALVFLVSLVILIKSANWFTEIAEKIGLALNMSPFVVGVTIVSIGTSFPELASSLISVFKGSGEIVAANILGSNIANILLVIGLAAVCAKSLKVKRNIINLDLPLLASCGVILIVLILGDGEINFFEGLISLISYVIYLAYLLSLQPKKKKNKKNKHKIKPSLIFYLIISIALIAFASNYLIESVIQISEILDVAKEIIAMSAVAIGTSLPELIVAISSVRKGKYEIAIGGVFGSNIFNSCVALGLPALFSNLPVSLITLEVAVPFFIAATTLFIISGITKRIYNWEGWMYLLIYILFISKIFHLF